MRGRIRGATSTIVSLAPRARIAFRIVNAMNPAPTMTTRLPGWTPRDHARAPRRGSRSEWTPGPSAPGIGALRRARAGGDQAVVVLDRGAVVQRQVSAPPCRARFALRPTMVFTFQAASDAGGAVIHVGLGDGATEVVRQDHARIRTLGGHEGDLGRVAPRILFLADRPDRVHARRCRRRRSGDGPASARLRRERRTRAVRSAAKSPIQSRGLDLLEGDGLRRARRRRRPGRRRRGCTCRPSGVSPS